MVKAVGWADKPWREPSVKHFECSWRLIKRFNPPKNQLCFIVQTSDSVRTWTCIWSGPRWIKGERQATQNLEITSRLHHPDKLNFKSQLFQDLPKPPSTAVSSKIALRLCNSALKSPKRPNIYCNAFQMYFLQIALAKSVCKTTHVFNSFIWY